MKRSSNQSGKQLAYQSQLDSALALGERSDLLGWSEQFELRLIT